MKKQGSRGNKNTAPQADKISETWYFVRLAFLAIAWNSRNSANAKGTLFKQYHLIQAKDFHSAFNKADRILSIGEHPDGSGSLRGKRVCLRKVGILDLEPLYEKICSGVELFDESELGVPYRQVKRQVISRRNKVRMINYEKKNGKQDILDVYLGADFDSL